MNLRAILGLTFIFSLPSLVSASITINEVAWMGDSISANHEWIELHNSSSLAISVEGWTLSDGMNLSIPLSGQIKANSYAVLERTSEESAPGNAFLVYTGALVNSGATLVLRDSSGTIKDQVAGGKNWQNIGGDNVTKETAQYSTSGWLTAVGTPGKVNAIVSSQSTTTPVTDTTKTSEAKKSGSSSGIKAKAHPATKKVVLGEGGGELLLTLNLPEDSTVNQPLTFSLEPSGVGRTIEDSLVFIWNFGDSFVAVGEEVNHSYEYPGEYMVSVRAEYGEVRAEMKGVVKILPVRMSLTRNEVGDVQINNDSPYEIDISLFTLRGTKAVVLPESTFILPRSTITIKANRLEDSLKQSLVAIYDQEKVMLASAYPLGYSGTNINNLNKLEVTNSSDLEVNSIASPAPAVTNSNSRFSDFGFPLKVAEANEGENEIADTGGRASYNDTDIEPATSPAWPYVLLVLLIIFCLLLIFKSKSTPAIEHNKLIP